MDTTLAFLLWVAAFAAFLYQAWYGKTPVAGLALAYWLNLASEHLTTEGLCLIYQNKSMYRSASEYGFPLTGYALLGLMIGALLFARLANRLLPVTVADATTSPEPAKTVLMAQTAIVLGMSVFLFGRLLNVSGFSAVIGAGHMMAIGGFAWWWWTNYRRGRRLRAWGVLACSLAVPLLILIFSGFLSFGIYVLMTLTAFVVVRFRPRWVVVIATVPFLYLGLSACVTYLNVRGDIRQSVWHEQAELSDRAMVIGRVFSERWEWFDPMNERQREALDARFDQNYFVGLAARRVDRKEMDYVRGDTVKDAVIALIPRILWRGKPATMGGTDQMAQFTGLRFSKYVTYGLGHVLEAYVNYGVPGLLVCFTVLGTLIGLFDMRAGLHLRNKRFDAFFLWFIPGQALLNGGLGSFAELTGGMAGCFVLTWAFLRVWDMTKFQEAALPTVNVKPRSPAPQPKT